MPYHRVQALCCFTGQVVCWPAITSVLGSALSQLQAVEQVISALHVIQGLDGSDRGKRKIQQVSRLRGCQVNMALLNVLLNVSKWPLPIASLFPARQLHTCFPSGTFCKHATNLHSALLAPAPAAARQLQLLPARPAGAGLRCAGRLGLACDGACIAWVA